MPNSVSKQIAVYQPHFLSISMTFIYRQLMGVADEYQPLVLATKLNNQEHFPYPRVRWKPKSMIESIYSTALRKLSGRSSRMFATRRKYWRRVLVNNDVKLIHAHFGNSGVEILPLARALSIPLLVTFHGADASNMLRNRHYIDDLQELFKYARVIAVSKTMAHRLEGIGANPDRLIVHYIGAPVEDFRFVSRKPVGEKAIDGDCIVLLQVSNFVEKKGHRYTLEAFQKFCQQYPNCRLVLAGDGPLKARSMRLSESLGIASKVEFKGAVSKNEVIKLMGEADIFLHHSVTAKNGSQEGLPTVLMEAMSTGLPAISTVHAGIPELIRDGDNGYLVEERDVDAYSIKLLESLRLPADMPDKASRTVQENFSLSTQNAKLKEIYSRSIRDSVKSAGS